MKTIKRMEKGKKITLYDCKIEDELIEDIKQNFELEGIEDVDEEMIQEEAYFLKDVYFEDLQKEIKDFKLNDVLCLANLGLWNGRKPGYKVVDGSILNQGVFSDSYYSIFLEDNDLRAVDPHHDGTNYYIFREIKDNVNIDNLLNDIYSGKEISKQKLSYYTKSIYPAFAELYGI